jgi:hypothetical protein
MPKFLLLSNRDVIKQGDSVFSSACVWMLITKTRTFGILGRKWCSIYRPVRRPLKSAERRKTVRAKRPVQQCKAENPRKVCNTCGVPCKFVNKSSNMWCVSWRRGSSAVA